MSLSLNRNTLSSPRLATLVESTMEPKVSLKRPNSIKKLPETWLQSLEDKQLDLLMEIRAEQWSCYKKKIRIPTLLTLTLCWLVFPVIWWRRYTRKLPEWQMLASLNADAQKLQQQRRQRGFLKNLRNQKNKVYAHQPKDLYHFYKILRHAARNYNSRIDLFDYALERQNKGLDDLFNVTELEQIDLTFQRVYDEIQSARQLLSLAENNPDIDFSHLIRDEQPPSHASAEYVTQTTALGEHGQFVQDLLILEASLKDDFSKFSNDLK